MKKIWKTRKKGFTLIELIVVMAIIGVLVLLAAPRFLGQTQEAQVAKIVNDISVAELKMDEHLIVRDGLGEWGSGVNTAVLDAEVAKGTLYDRKGQVPAGGVAPGAYSLVPAAFLDKEVRTSLEGAFYANEEGDVYYMDTLAGEKSPEGTPQKTLTYDEWKDQVEASPNNYVWATDADFELVVDAYDTTPEGEGMGYFLYTGDDAYIIIPDTIQGKQLTHHYMMFKEKEIAGVAAYNPNVTSLNSMFAFSEGTKLDLEFLDTRHVTDMWNMFGFAEATDINLRNFDTSKVENMGMLFNWSAAEKLDLSHFDTSKVKDMSFMFNWAQAPELDLSSFDTSNVEDMSYMFNQVGATLLDLSGFDVSNVTNMEGMFNWAKATTGYARTPQEASRFNDASETFLPDTLVFTVK